ncbi:protein of unknown function [Taphrina deformans PYCC 5710]|uniref:NAD(P)-binding domain-containing protein n=1 Tax=Taphrina deformans (strain PYCC 5710 / ATCC 11124 / CBS 356.35 / IMI 108563 / JCM 9778 / NBRC 8474) TaxID=1097556 RepID=R4XH65_TAPDE|nr:protein of unknown function [Taphrina deformans PYCC 5710]|eukprot:CCG85033.1 protein of unknown function [Taphrina deformans PYCC 5710]
MKAIILGSTGAVGRALVNDLVSNSKFDEIRAITRRDYDFNIQSPKFSTKVVDFNALDSHAAELRGFDAIFVTMGTTRAVAGSAENFIAIDQDLTVRAAQAALTSGKEQHLLYVSSAGASTSSYFLYPKSKGQTEDRLRALGATKTTIFRPAFLIVEEPRARARLVENIFSSVVPKARYLGIRSMSAGVGEVAKALRVVAEDSKRAVRDPVNNADILALCAE